MTENEKYLDSIQGKVAALNSEFQKFWTEGISSELVKQIIEFGTGVLKLVNDLGGLPTVLTAVVGIIATLKGYNIINSLAKVGGSLSNVIGLVSALRKDGFSLIEIFTGLSSSATVASVAIGGVAAALTIGVAAYSHYKQEQAKAREEALKSAEDFGTQANSIAELQKKYNEIWISEDDEETKAKSLAEIRKTLAEQYGFEKEQLDKLNESREAGNLLLNEESFEKAAEAVAKATDEIKKAQDYLLNDTTLNYGMDIGNNLTDEVFTKLDKTFKDISQKAEGMIVNLKGTPEELEKALVEAINYMSALEKPTQNEINLLNRFKSDLRSLSGEIDNSNETLSRTQEAYLVNNEAVQTFLKTSYQSKEEMEAAKQVVLDSLTPLDSYRKGFENIADSLFPEWSENATEEAENLEVETNKGAEAAEEYAKKMKELAGSLSECQTAYDTLSEVAKEYNETGSLTATTLANLLKLNPEYLQALSMENGQLIVNTDMLNQMAQGYATSAYEALTGVTGISAFGNALEGTATAGEAAAQRIAEAGNAAIIAGQKAFEGAKGFESLIGSIAAFAGTLKAGISGDKGDGTRDYGHGFDSQVAAYQENERKKFYEDLIAKMHVDTSGGSKKGGGGGGGKDSAEKAAKEAAKAYKEEFEKRISEIKFKFDMGDVTELGYWKEVDKIVQEFYANNEAYAEEYRDWTTKIQKGMVAGTKANYNLERDALEHKLAMDLISEEEFYRELEKLRQKYYAQDPIYAAENEAIEEEIYAFKKKKMKDLADERKRQRKKEWDEETDWLNEQKSRYETAFNYIDSLAQKEIDALEKQKQAIEDKYNAEIDKINETQDALNDEIELQEKLEALAKAQNTKIRVYREGVGFVYENDQSAVDEAKAALTQYQKEQDTKKEIKRLEDIRDATIESVEEQIKYWEKYRDEWKDMVNSYTEQQNKLIAEQVLGISLEGGNWEKRLGNLQDYVDRYNSILSQLKRRGDYDDDYDDDDYDYGTGGSGGSAGGGGTIGPGDHAGSGGHWDSSDSSHGPGAANGTTTGHGLTMVGEKGRELRVLGSGVNEADGIVPNHLTENLMKLGQYSPREWINAISQNPGNQQCSTQYSYAFDSLVLPNVTNADSFISELKNIKNQAIQMGGRRF